MKNLKFPLLGLAIVLFVSSCKRDDVKANIPKTSTATAAKASGWMPLNNWSSTKNDNVTTYFSTISDTAISADVAKSGLVLVYLKNGSQTQSLPFQDQNSSTYWYYQVSKGSVRIDGDNSSANQNYSGQNFSYFVLTPQQISNLQTKGKTKFDLMQLSYDQASALLK